MLMVNLVKSLGKYVDLESMHIFKPSNHVQNCRNTKSNIIVKRWEKGKKKKQNQHKVRTQIQNFDK